MGSAESSSSKTPHNHFFHKSIKQKEVFLAFVDKYLPEKIKSKLDMQSFSLWQKRFTISLLKQREADVVYEGRLKTEEECYFYFHIEQETNLSAIMPVRLNAYKAEILLQHAEQHPKEPLPLILSFVIYNGSRQLKKSLDIRDEYPIEIRALAEETFFKPINIIDLSKTSDEELDETGWASGMLNLLKHSKKDSLLRYLENRWIKHVQMIESEGGAHYVWDMIEYVVSNSELVENEILEIMQKAGTETEEYTMTLADRLRAEGEERGLENGRKEGEQRGLEKGQKELQKKVIPRVKELLSKGVDITFIEEITNLPAEDILALAEAV